MNEIQRKVRKKQEEEYHILLQTELQFRAYKITGVALKVEELIKEDEKEEEKKK